MRKETHSKVGSDVSRSLTEQHWWFNTHKFCRIVSLIFPITVKIRGTNWVGIGSRSVCQCEQGHKFQKPVSTLFWVVIPARFLTLVASLRANIPLTGSQRRPHLSRPDTFPTSIILPSRLRESQLQFGGQHQFISGLVNLLWWHTSITEWVKVTGMWSGPDTQLSQTSAPLCDEPSCFPLSASSVSQLSAEGAAPFRWKRQLPE